MKDRRVDANGSRETRPLGRSGLEISRLGFGAWAVGGGGWRSGWGAQDDAQSFAAIDEAVTRGINWIDTAAVYGHGHSEEVVGRAIARLAPGDRPMIFTKCGLEFDPADPYAPETRNSSPEFIRAEVERSLRRLGVERIDLYQIHQPDASSTLVEHSWGTMARLVDEGKVRAIGVSNFSLAWLARCERIRHVDAIQPGFSLLDRGGADELIP